VTEPHLIHDSRGGVAGAYSVAAEAWHDGPTRVYDTLAREQLASAQVSLAGAAVLDLGAGTGAASRAAVEAGARSVTAVDVAAGMLTVERDRRPPAVIGDALALPFAGCVFDVVVAAFSLNHVDDPVAALGEASRVTRSGGWVLSSSYATDDNHPVKQVVNDVASRWGWKPADWHQWLHSRVMPRLATPDRVHDAAAEAGLTEIVVDARSVAFAELGPAELVRWRLGLAQLAGFLEQLEPAARRALEEAAIAELGSEPPILVRSVLFLAGRVSSRRPDVQRRDTQ
jgi:ubiquinone/menaquinone biosynthesis C-methylase UbiE